MIKVAQFALDVSLIIPLEIVGIDLTKPKPLEYPYQIL
ncbi:hypothetical protein Gotri_014993 [Gossypium trilobum]|uniref:Uncharacterized protein n=1 Tax=Gossypium trilobum TaxID=34281 RepID=A0A7J9DYV9_9ROSI|nr:hypothetical protein [Gossypium trilobum]